MNEATKNEWHDGQAAPDAADERPTPGRADRVDARRAVQDDAHRTTREETHPAADGAEEPPAAGGAAQDDAGEDIQPEVRPAGFPQLQDEGAQTGPANLELLYDVSLPVTVELGRAVMEISRILELGPGSVVELERTAGEPVDVLVNGVRIGKGEVVVVDDRFGVRITHLLSRRDRVQKLA